MKRAFPRNEIYLFVESKTIQELSDKTAFRRLTAHHAHNQGGRGSISVLKKK